MCVGGVGSIGEDRAQMWVGGVGSIGEVRAQMWVCVKCMKCRRG